MPFVLIIVGLVLVLVGWFNTYAALGSQLQKDLFGAQGFIVWTIAIVAVGVLGYVRGWEKFSRWFLALILLAIVLAQYKNTSGTGKKNLIQSFIDQLKNPFPVPATGNAPSSPQLNATGVPGISTIPGTPADSLLKWWQQHGPSQSLGSRLFGF